MPEITGLLLAAGVSRRFGAHKLLAELAGRPLILHSAACLQDCDRILAVVRNTDSALRQLLAQAGIESTLNPQADRGMGASLACGVRASMASDAWCILPADMPFVRPATGRQVIQALRDGADIAAPCLQGRRGHPVGFSRRFRQPLLSLHGESGARGIIAADAQALVCLEVTDPGIHQDIDTPQDLARADPSLKR